VTDYGYVPYGPAYYDGIKMIATRAWTSTRCERKPGIGTRFAGSTISDVRNAIYSKGRLADVFRD
jgi:hypothetical protein